MRGLFFYEQESVGIFDPVKKCYRKRATKWHRNGKPDLVLVIRGVYVGVEVKAPKGVQSDNQKQFERDLRHAGGIYILARSVSDVESGLKINGLI